MFINIDQNKNRYLICQRTKTLRNFVLTSSNILFLGKLEYILRIEKSIVSNLNASGSSLNHILDNPSGLKVGGENDRDGFAIIYCAPLPSDTNEFKVH